MKGWFISSAHGHSSLRRGSVALLLSLKNSLWVDSILTFRRLVVTVNSRNSWEEFEWSQRERNKSCWWYFPSFTFSRSFIHKLLWSALGRVTSSARILRILFTVWEEHSFLRRGDFLALSVTLLSLHHIEFSRGGKTFLWATLTLSQCLWSLRKLRWLLSGCWWGFQPKRSGQLLWKILMWRKTFSVDFRSEKRWENCPICISVDLPILVSEFVSHRPPIIFESSESVIVWWSSSVLNGIFSRLNLKFAIKTRNQTFGNWRKSVKVVRTSLSLKWEKYEKAFKFAESCRKSWKVKAEPWSRTLIGEKLDKFQLFTHPNNPTNFRSSNISKVHHQREIFRRFRHDRKFSFSRESKKKKIIVKRVFSPKENWSWNCFRGCVCARSSAVLVHSIGDCANESEKKRKDFSDQHTQVQNIWMNFPTFSSICYVWGKIYFPIWWILSFVYSPRWW